MSKTIATETSVHQAAARLHSEGHDVTIDAVRALVGGGSETTILRHLQRWRELPREGVATPPMPEAVRACFGDLEKRLWREIWSIAAREIDAAKERAKAEVASASQRAAEAFTLSERHEVELERLRASAKDQGEFVARLQMQTLENAAAHGRCKKLEAELVECRQTVVECAERERQLELVLATHQGEVKALENQLATVEMQRTTERAQQLARMTELERREATACEVAARHAAVDQELSACRAELAACRAELSLRRGSMTVATSDHTVA
jgi:chromosome segregation ATPase